MSDVTAVRTTTRVVASKEELAPDELTTSQDDAKERQPVQATELRERYVLNNGLQERLLWHSGTLFAFSAVQCILFLSVAIANSFVLQLADVDCEDAIQEVVFGATALGYTFAALFALVLFDIGGETWCGRPHLILFLVWVVTAALTFVWLIIGLVSVVGSDCRNSSAWLYYSAVWSIVAVSFYYAVSGALLLSRLSRSRTKREPFVTAAPTGPPEEFETKPDRKEEDMLEKHMAAMENLAKLQEQADQHKAKANEVSTKAEEAQAAQQKAYELLQEEKRLSEERELRLQEKERELEKMRMELEVTKTRLQEHESQHPVTDETANADESTAEEGHSVHPGSDSSRDSSSEPEQPPLTPVDVLNATLPNTASSEKCSVCNRTAALECSECNSAYCDVCDSRTHCNNELTKHKRHRIGFHLLKDVCQRCEELPARVICKTCEQEYCDMCFKTLHKARRKRNHDMQYKGQSIQGDVIQPLPRKPPRKLQPLRRARPAPSVPSPAVEEGEIESQFSI